MLEILQITWRLHLSGFMLKALRIFGPSEGLFYDLFLGACDANPRVHYFGEDMGF